MLIFRLNAFSIYMVLSHMLVFAHRKKSAEDTNDGLINESSMPFRRNTGPDEIVMGKNVSIEEFPWQVSLQVQVPGKNLRHLCGGSIIAEKWVLTAEQCNPKYDEEAQKASWWKLMVVAGVTNLYEDSNPNYQKIEHQKWIGHQGYNPKLKDNDIALIELKDSFRFTEYVKSIVTSEITGGGMEVGDLSPITHDCVVSGWGDFSGNTLDAVNVEILPPARCLLETQKARLDHLQIDGKYEQMLSEMKVTEEEYFQFLTITFQAFQPNIRVETKEEAIQYTALLSGSINAMENTLCSWVKRDSIAGVCNGDFGSPIVCKKMGTEVKFVFGVASFFQKLSSMEVKPNPCVMNKLRAPVRFTNVGGYSGWIQNRRIVIKGKDSPPPKDGGNTSDLGFYLICCCVIANIIAQVII